jgi:hypothetical protein
LRAVQRFFLLCFRLSLQPAHVVVEVVDQAPNVIDVYNAKYPVPEQVIE